MNPQKALVLDANILIRAVLGRRVRQILRKYADEVRFFAPDVCFVDARKYVGDLAQRRGMPHEEMLAFLREIESIVHAVSAGFYQSYQPEAKRRIERRDPDDWPNVAAAMLLRCPIWTEDQDFFGAGIATWTSDRIELYLRGPA